MEKIQRVVNNPLDVKDTLKTEIMNKIEDFDISQLRHVRKVVADLSKKLKRRKK